MCTIFLGTREKLTNVLSWHSSCWNMLACVLNIKFWGRHGDDSNPHKRMKCVEKIVSKLKLKRLVTTQKLLMKLSRKQHCFSDSSTSRVHQKTVSVKEWLPEISEGKNNNNKWSWPGKGIETIKFSKDLTSRGQTILILQIRSWPSSWWTWKHT